MTMASPWVLLSAVLAACWYQVTARAVTSYETGPFTIVHDPTSFPTLTVLQAGEAIWSTLASGNGYLGAAHVRQNVTQNGGIFVVTSQTVKTCEGANITTSGRSQQQGYPLVTFAGQLCGEESFQLWFQAVDASDGNETATHLEFGVSLTSPSSEYNQLVLAYQCEEDERFYGFGTQYTLLDMKGQRLPVFMTEQGVGRGRQPLTFLLDLNTPGAGGTWYTTYTAVPFYLTNYQRAILLESMEYVTFDLSKKEEVSITLNSTTMVGRIITGGSPLELVQSYTLYSGRMDPLPEWVGLGAVLGLQGGTDAVLGTIQQVGEVWGNLSDVAAVWLQDWTGQRNFTYPDFPRTGLWWNWEVDSTHYPNWSEMISSLQSMGIKTLTYVNPLLTDVSKRGTPYQHNYYQEAIDNDYFVRDGSGNVWAGYSNSSIIDLSNTEAYNWLMEIIIENMASTGVCGWMADFGESVPLDASSQDTPTSYHALFPSMWGQLNAHAIGNASLRGLLPQNCTPDDFVYFMRSGNAHSPGGAARLFWLGDQTVTWDGDDGLASAIVGLLSSGLSGYSLVHTDIGGYTAVDLLVLKYYRSKELFLRWSELAAFTVMFRTHLGTLPLDNWQFNSDAQTIAHFFNMTIVFQSWGFYRETLMEEAQQHGWPIIRHMMLAFPDDPLVYTEDLRFQFLLGTELLVAPVYTEGASIVKVFLPTGTSWVHVWSGTVFKGIGEWVDMPAPIGYPCVLYQEGSTVGQQFVSNLQARKLLMKGLNNKDSL